jgi:hypothetical protein
MKTKKTKARKFQLRRLFGRVKTSAHTLTKLLSKPSTYRHIWHRSVSAAKALPGFIYNHPVKFGLIVIILGVIVSAITLLIIALNVQFSYYIGTAGSLLPTPDETLAAQIKYDSKSSAFTFKNTGASSGTGIVTTGAGSLSITAAKDASKGITVSDTQNNIDLTMSPTFGLQSGKQEDNRVVYPLKNGTGWAVYTMQSTGTKEDVILTHSDSDTANFSYKLSLGNSLVARVQSDGSIGIFGNTLLSGNVSTGTAADAALLVKARANAPKNTLVFTIPKPIITSEFGAKTDASAVYSLQGDVLTVIVSGLSGAHFPLAIDPSIYVVTAQQFMQGNNESNINFDIANKLIDKTPATGARFNTWNSTTNLPTATWGGSSVAAGGFIYSIGGTAFNGQIYDTQGTDTVTIPTGVTSITTKIWGGGGGGGGGGDATAVGGAGGAGGYVTATIPVTAGETLNIYVGGGGSAGTNVNGGTGGGGGGYSSIYRSTTPLVIAAGGGGGGGARQSSTNAGGAAGAGGGVSGVGGTASGAAGGGGGGTASAGGNASSGGTDPGTAGSSLTGGLGGNGSNSATTKGSGPTGGLATGGNGGSITTTNYAAGGGGGSGYFGGGGGSGSSTTTTGGGGGGGGSSFTAVTDTGVTNSTGSGTTPANSTDPFRNGAGSGGGGGPANGSGTVGSNGIVVVSFGSGGAVVGQSVSWAQFDPNTGAIDSADPGSGACSGWCTTSAYNLPAARTNFSLVAYNGYLYVMGGTDGTGTRQSTVYVAKLGANGEPALWSPTSTDKSTWTYWYTDSGLSSVRSDFSAVAYNNRMYLVGGRNATAPISTVEYANINPTGTLGSWTTSTALPVAAFGDTAQVYNSRLYVIGGDSTLTGTPLSSVYYNKINNDGSLNSWNATSSFSGGRISGGGNFSTIWGGYIYISGGCSTVNASGYCTLVDSDTQVASINADGSLDQWNTVGGVSNQVEGATLLAWRNNIYDIGGCSAQVAGTGDCSASMTANIQYGSIDNEGDASTVAQSVASGTAPCSGGGAIDCNLPGIASVGNMLNQSIITNGYLYIIGGCTNDTCSTTSSGVAYVAISSSGDMSAPATCPNGAFVGTIWCVETVGTFGITGGLAAASPVVFNNIIYLVGGLNGTANTNTIVRATVNADGSTSTWTSQSMTGVGATNESYLFAFARSSPATASTVPGNLFIFGGCATSSAAGCTAYGTAVDKCNIQTTGAIAACTTTGQLQLGVMPGDSPTFTGGLGIMSGTVYANYVYLVGGVTPVQVDLQTVIYAEVNSSNNIVAAPSAPTGSLFTTAIGTGAATGTGAGWTESPNQMAVGRRRAAAFGYNGYIYALGGYNGTSGSVLPDIEFIKVNTSDGSLGSPTSGFAVSSVTINQRWGLSVPVSNSFAYVIGGCTTGASPGSCTATTDVVQTFQIYNNDSGGPAGYTTSANTYGTSPNRIGASSTISNGYIYSAGGCTGASDCMAPISTVSYAPIDSSGNIGTWSNTTAALPAGVAWGKLLSTGGSLYYVGGQDSNGIAQSAVYYATPATGNVSTWSTATNGLPGARTQFGATVWNNRLYVVGGGIGTQNTDIYNTAGSGTFVVPTGVTSITVKVWGAGGAGGNGSGSTGIGGGGGGGGFTQSTLTVTPGATLTYNVGTGGTANTTASYGGNGGGYSAVLNGATVLIQAGGGGGGAGTTSTATGGQGGAGGGASGTAGTAGNGTATVGGAGGAGTTTTGGAAGAAGTTGIAGDAGIANSAGDGGGSLTNCTTAVTGHGDNGGIGAGGKGGTSATCVNGGGGGGGRFGGGGGGSGTNAAARGGGGGGGGSDLVTGATTTETAGTAGAAGVGGAGANNADTANLATAGKGGNGSTTTASTAGQPGLVEITYGAYTPQATVYVSPQLTSGGNITSAWSTASTSFNVARTGATAVAYANNLYVLGGFDGTNYLSDTQYSQINSGTGNAGTWNASESLPGAESQAEGFAANGYIYLIGGRSATTTCSPSTLVAPISANTTIASGNNPTGIGAWYATNQRYTGNRYGAGVAYADGKAYVLGGACGTALTYPGTVTQQTPLLSQPQIAQYSIMIDTDSDVYPVNWLINGIDNSTGANWQLKYQSMTNTTTSCTSPAMTTWGTTTNFGNVTLGLPSTYIPLNGSGVNTNCARFYDFNLTVDSSQAFGYPDDVSRGPVITDLTLQFTADPSKRLMHGRTFTGGLQQPVDTPTYAH